MADVPLIRDGAPSGMLPLFDLVNSYVDSLFRDTIGDFITEQDIKTTEDFANVQPQEWIGFLLLFGICVLVGLVFMICLPVCGICFCCCRCCCNCCKPEKRAFLKNSPPEPKKCKQYTCSVIFFILTATMLSMVVCSYVGTSMVKEEIGDNGRFMNDMISGVNGLETYLNNSLDDVEQAVFPPLSDTIDEVFEILDELPISTIQTLAKESGVDPALYELNAYSQSIPALNGNLTAMNLSVVKLVDQEEQLDNELTAIRGTLEPVLNQCVSTPSCQELRNQVDFLKPDAQYSHLDDVSGSVLITQAAIDTDIPGKVSGFVDDFEAIASEIDEEIGGTINDTKSEVDRLYNEMKDAFDDIQLPGEFFDDVTDLLREYQPYVEEYGTYAYQYLYVISTLCLVPVILYLIGLPLGSVGGPSAAKHASNCLYAGIVITFIFGFFFMLTTVLTFGVGGGVQGVGCRHIIGYDESAEKLEQVLRASAGNQYTYNLTVKELIENCKNDQSLYSAFQLAENGFNVSEYLDLENTPIPGMIESLKNITFSIGTITIITKEVNDTILAIENQTNSIDFTEYQDELAKPITEIDVHQYTLELYALSDELQTDNPILAQQIRDEADKLNQTYETIIRAMQEERVILSESATAAYTITSSLSLSSLMYDLTVAQDVLNTQTNSMIQEIIGVSADQVYSLLDNLAKKLTASIENDIAKCRPAFDSFTTFVYAPCVYFLYPFNAVWFSYGGYIAFATIALFFGTSLMGMFAVKGLGLKVHPVEDYDSYDGGNHNYVGGATPYRGSYPLNKVAPVLDEEYLPPQSLQAKVENQDSFVVDW